MLKTNSITPLSKRDLNEIAPSIFTTVPSPEVTDKYTHIPTEKVIDDMELLGWLPVEAKEVKARTKDTSGYQKHLVVFRNTNNEIGILDLYCPHLGTNLAEGGKIVNNCIWICNISVFIISLNIFTCNFHFL